MKALPYYRWYPTDAESDSKYAAMTLAELGLYHRCLNHAWVNNGLPQDPYELGRELRLSVADIKKLWPRVSQCFELGEVGRLVNKRQEAERSYALTKSEKAAVAVRSRYERNTDVGTDVERTNNERTTNDLPRAYESEYVSDSSVSLVTRKASKDEESDKWFADVFWPAWPVKENKESSKKAARNVKPEDRNDAICGVMRQAERIKAQERPIHASTWLNQRRWEDEAHTPSPRQQALAPYESPTDRAIKRAYELHEQGLL